MRIIVLGVVLAALCLPGCAKKTPVADEAKVVARINRYVMTADDFSDEARRVAFNKVLSRDQETAKEELLDEIITKKILLEEAQRRNLDKGKAFMKEIERYWEQALLKTLYRQKSQEIAATMTVSEKEVFDEYKRLLDAGDVRAATEQFDVVAADIRRDLIDRKVGVAIDLWIDTLKAKSRIVKDRAVLRQIDIR